MKTNKIRFSHGYIKLHSQKHATLLAVFEMNIKKDDLTKAFLEFDTLTVSGSHYKVHPGPHVVLVFVGDQNVMFTTIRPRFNRQKRDKLKYYNSLIGEPFEIVVEEKIPEDISDVPY